MIGVLMARGSYLAIILVLVASGAGLPVPEEVSVVTAGILASHGQLEPWTALAACLIGALGGDLVLYSIGRLFGRNVLLEHPRLAHFVNPQREAKIERMICRHGLKVLFAARFLIGLRSAIYLTAGILRVPVRKFVLTDLCCAGAVVSTFFLLSYRYGHTITRWIQHVEVLATAIAVFALVALAAFLWRRHRRKLLVESVRLDEESFAAEEPEAELVAADHR